MFVLWINYDIFEICICVEILLNALVIHEYDYLIYYVATY
jgi:hypothetical protein